MGEFGVDLKRVARMIDRSNVLDIQFQLLDKSLIVDFRAAGPEQPLAIVMKRAGSPRERMQAVKALRPSAPLPDRIASFTWPRGVETLEAAGILQRLRRRIQDMGADPGLILNPPLTLLMTDQSALHQDAVRGGEGFRTIWERSA